MKRRFSLILVALGLIASGAISTAAQTDDFLGTAADGVYRNGFFAFEMRMPAGWVPLAFDKQNEAKAGGIDKLKTGDAKQDSALEQAAAVETILTTYIQKPVGSVDNSSIVITALRQKNPSVTPRLVAHSARMVWITTPNTNVLSPVTMETIGGREFATYMLALPAFGPKMRSACYVAMQRGYAISVTVTYQTEQGLTDGLAALRSIKFTSK